MEKKESTHKKWAGDKKPSMWESGYNDRLLLHKGQLQHMLAYLDRMLTAKLRY